MPEVMIDIPIRKLAYMIDSMTNQELETLYMFLTEEGSELLERNRDLELGRVKYLSEEEASDVWGSYREIENDFRTERNIG